MLVYPYEERSLYKVSHGTISMQLHFDYATEYKKYIFSNAFRVQNSAMHLEFYIMQDYTKTWQKNMKIHKTM